MEEEPMTSRSTSHTNAASSAGASLAGFETRGLKILVVPFAYNEGEKIVATLSRLPRSAPFLYAVADDGSTDGSLEEYRRFPDVRVIRHEINRGLGAAMRTVWEFALRESVDVIVQMAGNNKDNPNELPRLLRPIIEEGYDVVHGSRYLPGGKHGNMPLYRLLATRVVHPLLFSLLARRRITDSSNGFRAYRTSLLRDPRIDWRAGWLDHYEMDPYVFLKAIRLGYKVKEVPVTKIYPPHELGYTKVKPITGWWSILKPFVYMALGIKR